MTAPESATNPQAVREYTAALRGVPERLLGMLDRERHSATAGSFDREHWAWKFRDFPLGMLQSAIYPLALLWRHPLPENPYFGNSRLLEWICAAMDQTIARQHRNGAFDAFAPNEQDPGPTLGVVHALAAAFRLVQAEVPAALRQRFLDSLRRACDFALRFPEAESHAFVSNHWALFALPLLDAHEWLGDARFRERANFMIERVISEQSSEGWYNEYGGPDPGYESLGIYHLAVIWRRTRSAKLLDSLRRSIEFYSHCVHPDGSVGGAYGRRHTGLYYPGGFEILAGEIPLAGSVARFMRERLPLGNVPTPATIDAENLPSFAYCYLEAALAAAPAPDAVPALPCESLDGVRYFPESGLCFAGNSNYYAVVNAKRGGLGRIFDKRTNTLAYEDAGYLVRARGRQWTSQLAGAGGETSGGGGPEVSCQTRFCEVRPVVPTPFRFLILRILNLTVFRSLALGSWVRRQIVARLILAMRPGPLGLRRRVTFQADHIRFEDTLDLSQPVKVEEVALPRSFTGIHMGSAKYFHRNELVTIAAPPVGEMAAQLNRHRQARMEFRVVFPPNQDARVVWNDAHTAPVEELAKA